MAWTNPATWLAGSTLTAASLNEQLRDNMLALNALAASASNVQSTHKTTTWAAALSLSWQDVTGFSVAITPTAATSKVLVHVVAHVGSTVGGLTQITMRVTRNGGAVVLPALSASRFSASNQQGLLVLAYLDSPATTAATTYQVQIAGSNGNTNYTYLNLTGDGTGTSTSSVTVQEVPVP
tara:strand:- start:125 stop:664 length:540 start_codon:yes stop_codon:yes gene_type:complete